MKLPAIIAVALLFAGLGAYVFWPEADEGLGFHILFEGENPTSFTMVTGDLEQRVSEQAVSLEGFERTRNETAIAQLWRAFNQVRPPRVRTGVSRDQLASYGMGSNRVSAEGIEIQWGERDGKRYAWRRDGTLFEVSPGAWTRIVNASKRLDDAKLLQVPWDTHLIQMNDSELRLGNAGWRMANSLRAPLHRAHIEALLQIIRGFEFKDFANTSEPTVSTTSMRFIGASGDIAEFEWWENEQQNIVIHTQELPQQELDAGDSYYFREAVERLDGSWLFAVPDDTQRDLTAVITVYDGFIKDFTLELVPTQSQHQRQRWHTLWNGNDNRAYARNDIGSTFVRAFNELRVDALGFPGFGPILGRRIHLRGVPFGGSHSLTYDPQTATSRHFGGRLTALPRFLRHLELNDTLDRFPLGIDPQRVDRFQRVATISGQIHPEVFARNGETWTRTYPQTAGPISDDRIAGIISSLCNLSADGVRLATERDRDMIRDYQVAFAMHIRALDDLEYDEVDDMTDTMDRDWGLFIQRRPDGWWGVDDEGLYAYKIPDGLIDDAFLNVDAGPIIAAIPSQIVEIGITAGDRSHRLAALVGGAWELQRPKGTDVLEAIEARRLIRGLLGLTGEKIALPTHISEATLHMTLHLPALAGAGQTIDMHLLPNNILRVDHRRGDTQDITAYTLGPEGIQALQRFADPDALVVQ